MLKNIVLVQVVIILILSGANIAKNTLVEKMTEYNTTHDLVVNNSTSYSKK